MNQYMRSIAAISLLVGAPVRASFAQHPTMPPGMTHEEHLARMQEDGTLKQRGAAAMGFDQDKISHHFRLYPTGGAIEVVANDPADQANLTQIRMHLKTIAVEFADANFAKPFATHGEVPPGVRTMQERKSALTFQYEETPDGGRVRIVTADPRGKRAVHEFLRYQIREHATGDPLAVGK